MTTALVAAAGSAAVAASTATWDLPLFVSLFAFAVASDLLTIDTSANPSDKHRLLMSGSFLSFVLAMVLLGGAPAALIGIGTIAIGHLRFGERRDLFLNNLVAYAWFPLLGGIAFTAARNALDLTSDDAAFYALVVGVFFLALTVNFLVIAGYNCYLDGTSLRTKARRALFPVLQWDLAAAALAVSVIYAYEQLGGVALAVFALVLLSSQGLLGQVLAAEQRAEQLEDRMEAFAKLHVGL